MEVTEKQIGNFGKNSGSGKKFEWDASYRVLTQTNTSHLDWVKWSHKVWENPISEVEVSGATNINYKNTYIILNGKLSIKSSNTLDID